MEISHPRIVFVPVESVSTPIDGLVRVFVDHYWIYVEGRGVLFVSPNVGGKFKTKYLHPQCNTNPVIAAKIRSTMYRWAEVKQIPVVYTRWSDIGGCYL